jgi:Hypothetical glycosyl hydrolase 6/Beta-galactosidase trimerisation domain
MSLGQAGESSWTRVLREWGSFMERRAFLKTTVAGMGVVAGLKTADAAGENTVEITATTQELIVPPDGYQPPEWLRYARAVYFEGFTPPMHPRLDEFDAERLVKVVVELGADTLRFQPIGFWAYFPTRSKYPIHPQLGNRDLLVETVHACRKAGLHIYCYSKYGNPSMEPDWVDKHPEYLDWVLRGPDGKPSITFDNLGWMMSPKVDATGDAYRQAIHQVIREYATYDIDGTYFDAPSGFGYTGYCYCQTCRRKFKEYCGMDIDRLQNLDDMEAKIAWYQWFNEMEKADLFEFRKTLHGHGKFMLCHNAPTWRPQALRQQYRVPDGFMNGEGQVQVYNRMLVAMMGASMARPTKKLSQMYMGSYSLSAPLPSHVRPRALENTSEEDGDEVLMDGFTTLAAGSILMYTTLNRLYFGLGHGTARPAQEVFEVMKRIEPLAKDSVPLSYVTVIPTWESLQLWRTKRQSWNAEMSLGFTLAMLDERISLDICPSTEVTESWLEGQRVIALCGASGLADGTARLLADWVRRGGGLLATFDTGLYDQNGQVRPGGALREVLGVDLKGEAPPSQPECHYRIKESHPVLGEYHSGDVVSGDGRVLPVEAMRGAKVLADCWALGTNESRGPAVVVNAYGEGRTVYINGSLEAHYTTSRVPSHRRILASAVRYLAGDGPVPFTISAARGVYGLLRRAPNADLTLWLLANVGYKDADIGRMRQEYVPVSNVEVRVLVPKGQSVKSVHLVRAQRDVSFTLESGYAVATIPVVHVAEVVHLELCV